MPADMAEAVAQLKKVASGAAKMRHYLYAPAGKPEESYFVVSKKKIPKSLLPAAKKESGAKKVYHGTCFKEDNVIVFECPIAVPKTLKLKLVQTIKKTSTYKPPKLVIRQNEAWTEPDDQDDDTADETAPAPQVDPVLAKLKAAVTGRLKDALASASPAQKKQIGELAKGARSYEGAGKTAEAIRCYKALAGLLGTKAPEKTPEPTGSGDDFGPLWKAATLGWRQASDAVDAQIAKLQAALRKTKDEELHEIAEFGLNGVTGNNKVPLMAAMRDVDAASGPAVQAAAAKAKNIVGQFAKHLKTDPRVKACDENPFGARTTIVKTLGAALARLGSALDKVPRAS